MRTRWRIEIHDLEGWLRIACMGFTHETRAAIAGEITAKFEQARADALRQDIPPLLAVEQALMTLGDPFDAGKRFRRVHLTEWEERCLARTPSLRVKVAAVFATVGTWVVWMTIFPEPVLALAPISATFITCRLFLACRQTLVSVLALYVVYLAASAVCISNTSVAGVCPVILVAWVAPLAFEDFHLQRKLRRMVRQPG